MWTRSPRSRPPTGGDAHGPGRPSNPRLFPLAPISSLSFSQNLSRSSCASKCSDARKMLEKGKEHHGEDDHPGDRDGGRDERGAGPFQPQKEPGQEHAKHGDYGENPETPEYRPQQLPVASAVEHHRG